jgi:flagella basal body P-ring formation protein FlgA
MHARTLCRLVISALLATAVLPALAQDRPVLRRDAVVAADIVVLGDLVENAGQAAGKAVFRAPALGQSGTIQAARVVEAARAAGLELDPAGIAQVMVNRAARRVQRTELELVVREALLGRYGVGDADVTLALENGETQVLLDPEATGSLRVTDLVYDARGRRVQAAVAVDGHRGTAIRPVRVSGQVIETLEVPVLTRAIARGEQVRATDVRLERRPRSEVQSVALADPAMLTGRVVRTALQAGALLRDSDLARQELVEKNGIVAVTYETPGLALSMRGKAMEGGGLGDTILVINPQSKRTLQAVVTGPGTVTVSFGAPGRVAELRSGPQSR